MTDIDELERLISRLGTLGIRSYRWPDGSEVTFRDAPGVASGIVAKDEAEQPNPYAMPTRAEIGTLTTTLAPPSPAGSPLDKDPTK